MCRHLAYLGEPKRIGTLLIDPPFSLLRQSWAPREQRYGVVNADGFGVGWYAPDDPVPARYRRGGPIWADSSFADLARVVRTGALLAAVRTATDGTAPGFAAAAPFGADNWLFSHNGVLGGWPNSLDALAGTLPPADLLALEARCDSALVWALVLRRLRQDVDLTDALTRAVVSICEHTTARLNMLLTDGQRIAATTWGDTLYYRLGPGESVVVASEPDDEYPGWVRVPDRALLLATPTGVRVTALPGDIGEPREDDLP